MFDRVCLMSAGHVVFEGERTAAAAWFRNLGYPVPKGKCNEADTFLSIIDCEQPGVDGTDDRYLESSVAIPSTGMVSVAVVEKCSARFASYQKTRCRKRAGLEATRPAEERMATPNEANGDASPTPSSSPKLSPGPAGRKWLAPVLRQIPALILRELRFNLRNPASVAFYFLSGVGSLIFVGLIVSGATFEDETTDFIVLASQQVTRLAALVLIVFGTLPALVVQE